MKYEGFEIGEKHTYRDWGLRCYDYKITLPESQKQLEQIPGRNGKIDVALPQQREAYGHRKIEIYCDAPDRSYEEWMMLVSDIANYVQDEYLTITPDFDPDYYYRGWVSISVSKEFKEGSDIIFTVDTEPYKLKQSVTEVSVSVEGETSITLSNEKKKVNPKIITDADMQIIIGDNLYAYNAGTYAKAGFLLSAGETELTLIGTGNISFEYREGKL